MLFNQEPMFTPDDNDVILVVLDCANIGWFFGKDHFSAFGIKYTLDYFERFEFLKVVAFIPASYINRKPKRDENVNPLMESEQWELLNSLYYSNKISIVPSGDHDEVYILSYSRDHSGFIISNDLFHDHLKNIGAEVQEEDERGGSLRDSRQELELWINNYRCGYTFVDTYFTLNPGRFTLILIVYLL